jgi:hypothetical protein
MKKKKSLSKLKQDLWKVFSLYIKLKYSSDGEHVNCFTCDSILKIGTSNCQSGHYYTKKGYPALYFNENNVRVQCYHCNINLSGNTVIFGERLEGDIGYSGVQELRELRHGIFKITRAEYSYLIKEYKEKVNELQKQLGVKYW